MATQAIEFKAPAKGINKDTAYSDFDPEFALDASNVLPFGTDNRRRIGQRPGTSKFYPTQLASGAPVRVLMQTTIPFDATTASAANTALDEPFTYANGTLNSVAGTRWLNKESASSGISDMPQSASSTSTRLTVASNALHYEGTGNVVSGVQLLDVITPGSVYVVKATVTLNATTSFAFWTRFPGWGNDCIRVTITNTQITGTKLGTTYVTYTPGGSPFTGTHTYEVRVNGNVHAVYMDNVLQTSFTTSDYSTIIGFGFGCGTSVAENDVEVDNYQILVGDAVVHNRQTNVVAVSGGSIYVGIPAGTIALATSGSAALSSATLPSACFSQGNVYFVDGTNLKKLVVSTATVSNLVATAGSLPTLCTLACVYRDRLVLAAPAATQQNFFMSRVGTHTDFDYSTTDSASAFAGNASTAGRIGEPIVALIPGGDDVLYFGGDHNIWAMQRRPGGRGQHRPGDGLGGHRRPERLVQGDGRGDLLRRHRRPVPHDWHEPAHELECGPVHRLLPRRQPREQLHQMAWDRTETGPTSSSPPQRPRARPARTCGLTRRRAACGRSSSPPCMARSPRLSTTATTPRTGRSSWARGRLRPQDGRVGHERRRHRDLQLPLPRAGEGERDHRVGPGVGGRAARGVGGHLGHGDAPERPYSRACY
jgi:hypothetical protein